MKAFYFVLIITLFVSCSSVPNETKKYNKYFSGVREEKETVVITYDISDSLAHDFIKIWISRQFQDGIREIIVDDIINGIIAGSSKVTTVIFRTEYTEFITYTIFIKNGSANLNIDTIMVTGFFLSENQEAADTMARDIFKKFNYRIKDSFQKIF